MQRRTAKSAMFAGVLGLLLVLGSATMSRAQLTVAAGWDLFQTISPGTTFSGIPFMGVPLGTFDFGPPIGVKNVDGTDTIVHRLAAATVASPGQTASIDIEMVALHLRTVAPVDFMGFGLDNYFVTLQSERGGPTSPGTMDITFANADGGTFSSSIDVFFDIRKGALNGPVVFSLGDIIRSSGVDWDRIPPPDAIVIDGVNHLLDGVDMAEDFWPGTPPVPPGATPASSPFVERGNFSEIHRVRITSVPEPASVLLMGLGAVVVGGTSLRRRRAA